jgi:hypothetical protein
MPESSLLAVILLLWSVPILIYAILFFSELKQLVLAGIHPYRNDESDHANIEMPFEYLLPMVAAAAIALIFGLLLTVSWPVCLMLMGAAAALIGGAAFTVSQMHTLGLAQTPSAPKLSGAVSGGVVVGDPAAMQVKQGTYTSHLPASTTFLEESNVPKRWRIIRRFLAQNPRSLYWRD